jgi:hypothetical protein
VQFLKRRLIFKNFVSDFFFFFLQKTLGEAMALMPNPAQQQLQQAAVDALNASLYVGDLDPTITEGKLYEIFSQISPVLSVRIRRDQISRNPLGYASVNYSHAHEGMALAFDEFRRPFIRIRE